MSINTDENKIQDILERGVEEVIVEEHLKKQLKFGKKLRIKFGIDPTSADLHLGHTILLRKLKQFQDLGHQIILLIGDHTARIGDPSGRFTTRKMLTEKQVKQNMKDYTKQAGKIINLKKTEIRYNSEWYDKKDVRFLMHLASKFTYAQVIARDEFKKRITKDIDVSMLELYYPIMQGYDSVELKADVEIGGTDQKFNLLFGRKVQKKFDMPQQDIITSPLLIGTDGTGKMSKSVGNYIKFTEEASKIYGKIMSIPDALIIHYFKLLTDRPLEEIEKFQEELRKIDGISPRIIKAELAKEIVKMYHGAKKAEQAEQEFNKVFRDKKMPTKMANFKASKEIYPILDLLFEAGLANSKGEARRLVVGNGVKINDEIKTDWKEKIKVENGMVIQVGKLKYVKIKL